MSPIAKQLDRLAKVLETSSCPESPPVITCHAAAEAEEVAATCNCRMCEQNAKMLERLHEDIRGLKSQIDGGDGGGVVSDEYLSALVRQAVSPARAEEQLPVTLPENIEAQIAQRIPAAAASDERDAAIAAAAIRIKELERELADAYSRIADSEKAAQTGVEAVAAIECSGGVCSIRPRGQPLSQGKIEDLMKGLSSEYAKAGIPQSFGEGSVSFETVVKAPEYQKPEDAKRLFSQYREFVKSMVPERDLDTIKGLDGWRDASFTIIERDDYKTVDEFVEAVRENVVGLPDIILPYWSNDDGDKRERAGRFLCSIWGKWVEPTCSSVGMVPKQ